MASTFKYDSAGFLIGDLIDLNHDLLDAQGAGMAVWRGIHSDVKAIARALGVQARSSRNRQAGGASQTGPARDSQGRYAPRVVDSPAGRTAGGAGGRVAGAGGSAGAGGGRGVAREAATGAQRAASATGQGSERRAVVTPGGRSARGRFTGVGGAGAVGAPDELGSRDARGRFTGGGNDGGGGTSDKADNESTGRLTNAIEKLGLSLNGADQIDPTIAAMKEVQEVLTPVGRGFGVLFGHNAERDAERKKEVWYKRIIKALKGKKDPDQAFGRSGGAEDSSGFMGGIMAMVTTRLLPMLWVILAGVGVAIVAGLGLLGGIKLGALIYKWLDDSGVMTRIFDAIDSMKQAFLDAGGWIKKKYEGAKEAVITTYEGAKTAVKNTINDFNKGVQDKTEPAKIAPPVIGQSGRNINDPRRVDRETAVSSDGRMINDPRRLDAQAPTELPPATSMAQRAGRVVGGIRRLLGVDGTQRMYENTDGSTETRSGGSVSWRNNNPGNLKLEYAGSADPTVKTKRTKEQALKAAQSRYEGVVDLDQWGNAIFSTEDAGRAAKAKLLMSTHGGKTIEEMLPKYAVNDYSGQANHKAYAAGIYKVATAQGVDLNGKKIGELNPQEMSALLDGMKKVEGFKVGTVSPVAVPQGILGMAAYSGGVTVSAGQARIPPMAIPSSVPERIAPVSETAIPARLNTNKPAPVNVSMRETIGQDVGDRAIAHVVSGGLGATG